MATEAIEATDKKVEVPERIWVGRTALSDPSAANRLTEDDVEYVRVDAPNTRQRAERAARKICEEFDLVEKYTLQAVADIIAAEFEK